VAGSLGGTYFNIDAVDSAGAVVENYVWFDTGSDADPAPANRVGIEITISENDSAADVASALQAGMETEGNYRAKISTDGLSVVIRGEYVGKVTTAAADVDTGFTIEQITSGLGGSLGKTSGGVSVSMTTESVTIQSDQTGALVLDEVITGQTVEVSMSLLEMTAERWETVVGSVTGSTYTPSGGTQLVGYGSDRLYASLFDLGGELLMHPTRKDAADKSFDITLFKSAPKPSSINFSGSDPQVMEVTFTALLDSEVQSAINLMAFGDSSQDVRA
jgi:hypothetical protein